MRSANGRVTVIPMIETAQALADVEAIAAVPGVDALFVGPFDLSIALGLPPGDNDGNEIFDDALTRTIAAASAAGIALAVLSNQLVAPRRVAQGFQMVSVTMDTVALATASTGALDTVRDGGRGESVMSLDEATRNADRRRLARGAPDGQPRSTPHRDLSRHGHRGCLPGAGDLHRPHASRTADASRATRSGSPPRRCRRWPAPASPTSAP